MRFNRGVAVAFDVNAPEPLSVEGVTGVEVIGQKLVRACGAGEAFIRFAQSRIRAIELRDQFVGGTDRIGKDKRGWAEGDTAERPRLLGSWQRNALKIVASPDEVAPGPALLPWRVARRRDAALTAWALRVRAGRALCPGARGGERPAGGIPQLSRFGL